MIWPFAPVAVLVLTLRTGHVQTATVLFNRRAAGRTGRSSEFLDYKGAQIIWGSHNGCEELIEGSRPSVAAPRARSPGQAEAWT